MMPDKGKVAPGGSAILPSCLCVLWSYVGSVPEVQFHGTFLSMPPDLQHPSTHSFIHQTLAVCLRHASKIQP